MAEVTLLHNRNCGSSRKALAWLRDHDVDVEVVEYLKTPLGRDELAELLRLLPTPPSALVRRDKRFAALGLGDADVEDADAVVSLLVEHPELMQRPVVRTADRAVIARPPEATLEAFFAG
jgi:arsenate reductase